jgi:hypothetical protein
VIQAVFTLREKPRPEARDDAFARELGNAAFGVGEGLYEIFAQAVEFGVSEKGSVGAGGMGLEWWLLTGWV